MGFVEFTLRGIEKLPPAIRRVKDSVCAIIAYNEHKLKDFTFDKLSTFVPILYSLQTISKGTGFLTTSGHVITAFHVIEKYSEICAITSSNKKIRLDLVKKDEKYDIAVLKPEERWCNGLEIRSAAEPQLGSLVFTIGYPLSFLGGDPVLSVGFLSNVSLDKNGVENLVVNASFNVGNSGGPLISEDGLFLGIVKAKGIMHTPLLKLVDEFLEKPEIKIIKALIKWIADNVQTNIGFAIPGKYVRDVVRD